MTTNRATAHERRGDETMGIRLSSFDGVMVNSSGGKDSQTSLRRIVKQAQSEGYPLWRIVVAHADLRHMEWPGVKPLAEKQAHEHGIEFEWERYRNRNGDELLLLDYVRKRRKWPGSTTRFCTSEFKRSPCGRVLTRLHRRVNEHGRTKLLNVFGFRAEESPARKKKAELAQNKRFSTQSREVWDFLPIHGWQEREVWDDIHSSGVPYHPAYDLGMPRLSCQFCVFAPRQALMIAGRENPELLKAYVDLETEIGHDFQHNKPIRAIKEALDAGEEPDSTTLNGAWNM